QLIDFQTIFMVAMSVGFVGLVSWGMQNALGAQQGKRKVRGAPSAPRVPVTKADASWLEGTSVGAAGGGKRSGKKSRK
ncbi:hypothetical protein SARC_13914, partial [Sphaeroforma arctica JP610]